MLFLFFILYNEDIKSIIKVLKSDFITQGQEIKKFEKNLTSYFGSKYSTAVSSGTAALHLIGLSLGWKKEKDNILTSKKENKKWQHIMEKKV